MRCRILILMPGTPLYIARKTIASIKNATTNLNFSKSDRAGDIAGRWMFIRSYISLLNTIRARTIIAMAIIPTV